MSFEFEQFVSDYVHAVKVLNSVEQRFHTEKKNVPPSDSMKERNLSPGPYTIW